MLISKSFLLPLVCGMLVRRFFPNKSESIADKILTVAGLVLTCICGGSTGYKLAVTSAKAGWSALFALSGLTLISLIIGHLMGGEEPSERTALAVSCATRHLGL